MSLFWVLTDDWRKPSWAFVLPAEPMTRVWAIPYYVRHADSQQAADGAAEWARRRMADGRRCAGLRTGAAVRPARTQFFSRQSRKINCNRAVVGHLWCQPNQPRGDQTEWKDSIGTAPQHPATNWIVRGRERNEYWVWSRTKPTRTRIPPKQQ
jgi:hypothetical protein